MRSPWTTTNPQQNSDFTAVPQQSGLRLDNRSTGLLLGLIVLAAIGILVGIWLDGRGDGDPTGVETAGTETVEQTELTDTTASTEPVVLPTVPVIPTAIEPAPTSVFVAAGAGATTGSAPASDTDTAAGTADDDDAVASGFEEESADGTFGFEDEDAETFPTPTPASAEGEPTPRPNDPFAFAGESSWWEQGLVDDGATIATNELDFVINQDGTGSMRGMLEVSWTDGRAWSVDLDQDFVWDTGSANVRSTIDGTGVVMDGEQQDAGTMAIRDPADGFGSLCFAACISFQYEPPFWSLSPDA